MTSSVAPSALEICIRLTDASECRFNLDPAAAAKVLSEMQPGRLFAVPHLMLGGNGSLSIFPTARVERVDLARPGLPQWPFLSGATSVREVTEDYFLANYDPTRFASDRSDAAKNAGSSQVGFTEYRTVSGLRILWEVHMESREMSPTDFKPYIQTLLTSGGLHATTDSGVAIINPANLSRVTFHPGPPELPAGVWPTQLV